jgi:hypothetical protein
MDTPNTTLSLTAAQQALLKAEAITRWVTDWDGGIEAVTLFDLIMDSNDVHRTFETCGILVWYIVAGKAPWHVKEFVNDEYTRLTRIAEQLLQTTRTGKS